MMFKNYLTIALRNLRKNQAYALINIVGLALGIGCALLIFALVRYHYQTDRHHTHASQIYRITSKYNLPDGAFFTPGVPLIFGKTLRTDYPDIAQVVMLDEWEEPMVAVPGSRGTETKFKEKHAKGAFVEPSFFKLFDYTWLSGGPAELNQPGTVVLEAKLARQYFGTENAVGKTLKLVARYPVRVVGVFANYRDNTDFGYTIMPSWASWEGASGAKLDQGFGNTNSSTLCFVLFNDRFTAANWAQQMPAFVKKHKPQAVNISFFPAQKLADIHFATDYGGVSRGLLMSLLAIGVLLIGTACINFVNLATAQALNRSREVGVRKVLGSTRGQLFGQFLGETTLIVALATGLGMLIFSYGLQLAQVHLHGAFKFTFYFEPSVLVWLGLLLLVVVGLSGLYPALVLAGFRPVVALAGKLTSQQVGGGFSVRRGLVVAQFAISQVLVIGLVVVSSQLNYVRNKDLGFRRNAIMTVQIPNDLTKMQTFKQQVQALPNVQKFSYSMSGPPQSGQVSHTTFRYDTRPDEEKWQLQQMYCDADYLDMYGLKLVAGRNLQPSDTVREALVNEVFMQKVGAKTPAEVLGKVIHNNGHDMAIVGVLKNYNQQELRSAINPLFVSTQANRYFNANVQVQTGNFQQVIGQLGAIYNRVYPDSYFESHFVDDQIEESYQEEQTMGSLVNFFAAVALLIGCMGLYGLVLFMVSQKTKEIGVRKVLGASMGSILWLFGREFSRLIAIAFVLAVPIAWWVMSGWLQTFQYKIALSPGIFALALLATVLVAGLTVSFQSIRAALANPVESLRSE